MLCTRSAGQFVQAAPISRGTLVAPTATLGARAIQTAPIEFALQLPVQQDKSPDGLNSRTDGVSEIDAPRSLEARSGLESLEKVAESTAAAVSDGTKLVSDSFVPSMRTSTPVMIDRPAADTGSGYFTPAADLLSSRARKLQLRVHYSRLASDHPDASISGAHRRLGGSKQQDPQGDALVINEPRFPPSSVKPTDTHHGTRPQVKPVMTNNNRFGTSYNPSVQISGAHRRLASWQEARLQVGSSAAHANSVPTSVHAQPNTDTLRLPLSVPTVQDRGGATVTVHAGGVAPQRTEASAASITDNVLSSADPIYNPVSHSERPLLDRVVRPAFKKVLTGTTSEARQDPFAVSVVSLGTQEHREKGTMAALQQDSIKTPRSVDAHSPRDDPSREPSGSVVKQDASLVKSPADSASQKTLGAYGTFGIFPRKRFVNFFREGWNSRKRDYPFRLAEWQHFQGKLTANEFLDAMRTELSRLQAESAAQKLREDEVKGSLNSLEASSPDSKAGTKQRLRNQIRNATNARASFVKPIRDLEDALRQS